jgi:hypothetical protein
VFACPSGLQGSINGEKKRYIPKQFKKRSLSFHLARTLTIRTVTEIVQFMAIAVSIDHEVRWCFFEKRERI